MAPPSPEASARRIPWPQKRWPRLAATLAWIVAAGCLVSVSWAPLYFGPAAVLGLWGLLRLVHGRRARARFFWGWLGGAVCFGLTFHWVSLTMQEMSGLSPAVSYAVVGIFGLWHGLLWALFALGVDPLRRWSPKGAAFLTVPTLWALLEGFYPSVFPIYLGYAWGNESAFVQVADLTGIAGPSFFTVLLAHALWELTPPLAGQENATWRGFRWTPVVVAGAACVVVFAYGLVRLHQIEGTPATSKLRLALVQPNPTIAEKRSKKPAVRNEMLRRALALTRPLVARRGTLDAVIWPEGAFPWYLPDLDAALANQQQVWRQQGAREIMTLHGQLQRDLVLGSLRRVDERTRNSAAWVSAAGEPTRIYDKVVLVPFGEYFPGSDWIPALKKAVPGISDLQPGPGPDRFTLAGHSALVTLCYEAIYPGFVRGGLQPEDELILNLTNDVWFGDSRALDLHLMGQVFRAVENRVPLVRATATGISAIVDETGRITQRTKKLELGVLEGVVPLREISSFYRVAGDVFLWVAVGATVLLCCGGVVRRRRRAGTSA